MTTDSQCETRVEIPTDELERAIAGATRGLLRFHAIDQYTANVYAREVALYVVRVLASAGYVTRQIGERPEICECGAPITLDGTIRHRPGCSFGFDRPAGVRV